MTSIRMFLSYNNNEKVVEVPVIPNELPDIVQDLANEEMTTHTSTITLLGNKKPRSFSLDLFLPTKHYDFAKDTGTEILNLLGYVSAKKIPMRVVVTDGLNELLNIAVSISSFKYHYDTVENIRCNVSFKEYIFVTNEIKEDDGTIVEFKTVKTKIGNTTANISGVNVEGHNLVRARDVLDLLGIEVGWNAEKKRVTANGKVLDIYTEIHNGSAYCYARDLAGETNKNIGWDSDNKTVIIKDNKIEFEQISIQINNKKKTVSGININGSNLVNAREFLLLLGIDVGWNAERKRVTANGKLLDIHTRIYDDLAYCFIRDLARETGYETEWDSNSKTVIITGGDKN